MTQPDPNEALPEVFTARMRSLLGDEAQDFFESCTPSGKLGLRANTLKIDPQELARLLPFQNGPLESIPAGFRLTAGSQAGRHPYHAAGLYYLQDPSAMAAAHLLDPQPGERVLDLSAAPGGKTTHLAMLMQNQGLLVANEIDRQRAWDLAENMERCGLRQAVVLNESPGRLAEHFGVFFDRVLVDAPCSGEGMFWKSEAARQQWSPGLVESCAIRQSVILDSASQMVRPGGRLAYVTCTFSEQENEAVVSRFLNQHPDFEPFPAANLPGAAPGVSPAEWPLRLYPHRFPGGGQFIALMQRRSGPVHSETQPARAAGLSKDMLRIYLEFCRSNFDVPPAEDRLELKGSYLYQRPPGLPSLSGLKVIHPGWWLGEVRTSREARAGRFEPAHALALGMDPARALRQASYAPEHPDLLAYLRGEAIHKQGEDGWTLVTVSGYALGWAKRVNGVLKNHYPKGLRVQTGAGF